jgi:hypothetical protein
MRFGNFVVVNGLIREMMYIAVSVKNRFNVVYHLLGFVINLFYLIKKLNYEK